MKELLVPCVSLTALAIAGRAEAADSSLLLPVKPPASTAYDWTGFYAGGHLGYAWGSSNWTASTTAVATPSTSGAPPRCRSSDGH